jgi:hypothetical protein
VKIIFAIEPDKLTWAELDMMEEASDTGKIRPIRRILARFMVDEDGQPLTHEAAMATLGALKLSEIRQATEAFSAELGRQLKSEVPPDS